MAAIKKKPKQWFVVQIEALAPISVEYRILADDEREALQMAEKGSGPNIHLNSQPKINIPKMRKLKAKVKGAYTNLITLTKTF